MKALKIVSCDCPRKWYADLIGCYVPFINANDKEYGSREPAGYLNFISLSDAEVVDIEDVMFYDRGYDEKDS